MIWTRDPTDPVLFRHHWESIRRGGRRRYILLRGVLGWGWPVALLSTIISQVIWSAPGPFVGRLGLALLVFSFGGIAFGAFMWARGERRCHELDVRK